MRDITKVIERMREVTPGRAGLHDALNAIESSVRYTAPEVMGSCWRKLTRVFADVFVDAPDMHAAGRILAGEEE